MKSAMPIALITALFLTANASPEQPQKSVLLPQGAAQSVTRLCSRGGPAKVEGTWQPSKADLDLLESRLPQISKLSSGGGMKDERVKDPNRYYRQYVAIIVEGRKFIYVNGICQEKPPSNWHQRLADVCDGGCNWGVLYDPNTGRFSDLQMNGVA